MRCRKSRQEVKLVRLETTSTQNTKPNLNLVQAKRVSFGNMNKSERIRFRNSLKKRRFECPSTAKCQMLQFRGGSCATKRTSSTLIGCWVGLVVKIHQSGQSIVWLIRLASLFLVRVGPTDGTITWPVATSRLAIKLWSAVADVLKLLPFHQAGSLAGGMGTFQSQT